MYALRLENVDATSGAQTRKESDKYRDEDLDIIGIQGPYWEVSIYREAKKSSSRNHETR